MDFDPDLLSKQLERELEVSKLAKTANDIYDTYLWVLCALGIPGNLFTIITILTMGKMSPATLFVALLAACDGLALVSKIIYHQLFAHNVYMGDAGCKLSFIPQFLSTMANWALVLIALERFFSVCFPLKKLYLFTRRRSYLLTGVTFVTLLVIFAVFFGVFFEASTENYGNCGTKLEHVDFFTKGWYWINACLYLFLPFTINTVLTAFIIRGLVISRRARRSMSLGNSGSSSAGQDNNRKLFKDTERAERMITIMLIMASILFLILTLPGLVYLVTYNRAQDDDVTRAKYAIFEQVQFLLIDSTHAINFFLYFISAKRFRNQFIYLLTCKRWPAKRRQGNSNSTETSKLSSYQMQDQKPCHGSKENLCSSQNKESQN